MWGCRRCRAADRGAASGPRSPAYGRPPTISARLVAALWTTRAGGRARQRPGPRSGRWLMARGAGGSHDADEGVLRVDGREEGPLHHVGCEEGPLHHADWEEGPLHHMPTLPAEPAKRAKPAQRKPNLHTKDGRKPTTPVACLPSRRPGEARSHRVKGAREPDATPCTSSGPPWRGVIARREVDGRAGTPILAKSHQARLGAPLGDLPVRRGPPGGKPTTGKTRQGQSTPLPNRPRDLPVRRGPPRRETRQGSSFETSTARERGLWNRPPSIRRTNTSITFWIDPPITAQYFGIVPAQGAKLRVRESTSEDCMHSGASDGHAREGARPGRGRHGRRQDELQPRQPERP